MKFKETGRLEKRLERIAKAQIGNAYCLGLVFYSLILFGMLIQSSTTEIKKYNLTYPDIAQLIIISIGAIPIFIFSTLFLSANKKLKDLEVLYRIPSCKYFSATKEYEYE